MSNISQIKNDTNWDEAVSTLNTNFANLSTDVAKAKAQTMIKLPMCDTLADLKVKYPPAYEDQMGLVGTSFPATLYKVKNGQWVTTGSTVEGASVVLTECVGYDSVGTTEEVNI